MKVLPDPNRPLGTTKAFLPYEPHHFLPTLEFAVTHLEVDGRDVTDDAVDPARCRVRPHVVGEWSELTATVHVPPQLEAIAAAAFPDTTPAPPLALVGRLACRDTRYRAAVWFSPGSEHGFEGTFHLRAEDLLRFCTLDVLALRQAAAAARTPTEASLPRSRLATSPQWVIEVTEPFAPTAGAFDFAHVDFTNPEPEGAYRGQEAELLRTIPVALSHVLIRPEGPLILINRARPEIIELMEARGTVGFNARLRDVVTRQIAGSAWRTLLTEAWLIYRDTEDTEDIWDVMGPDHWSLRTLDHAAGTLFGKRKPDRLSQLLDLLAEDATRPGHIQAAAERLSLLTSDPISALIEEARRA